MWNKVDDDADDDDDDNDDDDDDDDHHHHHHHHHFHHHHHHGLAVKPRSTEWYNHHNSDHYTSIYLYLFSILIAISNYFFPKTKHEDMISTDLGQLKAQSQLTTRLQAAILNVWDGFTERLPKASLWRFVRPGWLFITKHTRKSCPQLMTWILLYFRQVMTVIMELLINLGWIGWLG